MTPPAAPSERQTPNSKASPPEESAGQYKIMRPIRPERERSHGSFFSKSATSRAERSVIEFVRLAQKDRFFLQEIDKLSQVPVSNGQVFRRRATLSFHALNPNCNPRP